MPRRPGEGEAAREPRDLGDAVHPVAAVRGEREHHLARAELALHDLDLQRPQHVLERGLAREEREERDEAIDRGQQHHAARAQRDALRVEPEAWSPEASLVEGDADEHVARERRRRGRRAPETLSPSAAIFYPRCRLERR
jgi:hypothetical protein